MAQKDIIQELNELQSTLTAGITQPAYAVPEGYFEGFASQMLNRIKAMNAANANEELGYLSPILSGISKDLPYSVPQGYFNDFKDSILENVRSGQEYQSADEELEELSPLLSGIGKKIPYSVPGNYFENFQVDINAVKKEPAKVIPIRGGVSRKWYRYATAAVIVGVIAMSGILFFRSGPQRVDVSNTHAWVEQNMKKVSTTDINSFIQQTSESNVIAATVKTNDIKEMMKDVSDKDIQNFLNETETSEENSDDLFLN